jgi:hypothetical protein
LIEYTRANPVITFDDYGNPVYNSLGFSASPVNDAAPLVVFKDIFEVGSVTESKKYDFGALGYFMGNYFIGCGHNGGYKMMVVAGMVLEDISIVATRNVVDSYLWVHAEQLVILGERGNDNDVLLSYTKQVFDELVRVLVYNNHPRHVFPGFNPYHPTPIPAEFFAESVSGVVLNHTSVQNFLMNWFLGLEVFRYNENLRKCVVQLLKSY